MAYGSPGYPGETVEGDRYFLVKDNRTACSESQMRLPMKVFKYPSTRAWLLVVSTGSLIIVRTDAGVAFMALYNW